MTKDAAKEGTSPDRGLVAVAVTKVGKDMKSDIIDTEMHIHHITERAVLVSETADPNDAVWLPLSQVEVDGKKGGVGVITLPEWLALEKGLI